MPTPSHSSDGEIGKRKEKKKKRQGKEKRLLFLSFIFLILCIFSFLPSLFLLVLLPLFLYESCRERGAMKNTIKCCISCILPCGALDVVRIVHSNGHVEEISGTITASEIMKAHPKHVLKKPSSPSEEGVVPKIVVVPPDAELQRGKIYFLMPMPPPPPQPEKTKTTRSRSSTRKKRRDSESNNNAAAPAHHHRSNVANNHNNAISMSNLLISDRYLSEILSEKISTQRDRRRGRVGVWRPHLESISETPNDL